MILHAIGSFGCSLVVRIIRTFYSRKVIIRNGLMRVALFSYFVSFLGIKNKGKNSWWKVWGEKTWQDTQIQV